MKYFGQIAGIEIPWEFRFPDTALFLRKYISDVLPEEQCATGVQKGPVSVTDQEFSDWEQFRNTSDDFAEFCILCEQTSEYLLQYDRCIFHAVALAFQGRSWLIAAGSGVGKSTLCKQLADTFPGEISIINGDKPALEYRKGQGFIVHPSPWNGKEGWQGAPKAPLAGIFLLRRGPETTITQLEEREAVVRIYLNIFQSFTEETVIRAAGNITEAILKTVPVWSLTSKCAEESAELVYRKMQEGQDHEL